MIPIVETIVTASPVKTASGLPTRAAWLPGLPRHGLQNGALLAALAILFTLTGCGGGGSAGTTAMVTTNAAVGTQSSSPTGSGSGNPPGTGNPQDVVQPQQPAVAGPETAGQWSALHAWPLPGVHMQLLPNGKVLTWAYRFDDHDETSTSKAVYEVDIPTDSAPGAVRSVFNNLSNVACSGFTLLPDGRFLLSGGESPLGGSVRTTLYDYLQGTWTLSGDMNGPRWYPTALTLANGDVLSAGGLIDFATESINLVPQVWSATTGWRDLGSASYNLGTYPRLHLAPNGMVFKAGMDSFSRYLDTRGSGGWSDVGWMNYQAARDYGTSVIYGEGKVIAIGGGDPPTNTAEIINLNDDQPQWQWTSSMRWARRHLNATLLADGKILVTGGTASAGFNDATQAVLPAELWDPATGQWTIAASMSAKRVYHSTALLLPDGRVLASGGGDPAPVNGVTNLNSEIYSPPYLFKGARPVIASAPESIRYGETFNVQTPDAANVVRATWIRLSSVTHAFNNSQRLNELTFTRGTGVLRVNAPTQANVTPPGHYMLFLINSNGVPSVARIIQIT